jgi:hypothetical protein
VVYLTPDCDRWDPQATHYADAEAGMINNCVGDNFFVELFKQHAKKKSVLKIKSSSHKNYKITTTQQREKIASLREPQAISSNDLPAITNATSLHSQQT